VACLKAAAMQVSDENAAGTNGIEIVHYLVHLVSLD
jgi:hypothetical protein